MPNRPPLNTRDEAVFAFHQEAVGSHPGTTFYWDGATKYIEVSVNGSTEFWTIPELGIDFDRGRAAGWLDFFHANCLAYLIEKRVEAISRGQFEGR